MEYYSSHINKLIEQFSHLPGIGAKSAQRLASYYEYAKGTGAAAYQCHHRCPDERTVL